MTRILILDDDREMLSLIGLILERAGYEHLVITEGNEVWALLNTESIVGRLGGTPSSNEK